MHCRPLSKWQTTPVLLPGKSHGQRSVVGYSPGVAEWDTTERLHFHFPPQNDYFLTNTDQTFQVTRNLIIKNAQIDDISKRKSN